MLSNISDIKNAFYINLESRPDRKKHVEKQLKNIGISAERFNAIKLPNGALGCSMSHLKCLEIAKQNDWDSVLIIEDDIQFLDPTLFISQLNKDDPNNIEFLGIYGNDYNYEEYIQVVGSSANNCISCNSLKFRELFNSNTCICINGYYESEIE